MGKSSTYQILIKKTATKEIRDIRTKKDRSRILDRIAGLAHDPRPPGCQKLSAREAYRIRVGRYRIVYTILDDKLIVEVIRVAHRKEVYR